MAEIIPAILTKDPLELQEKLGKINGLVPWVQIDYIDGIFVANKTVSLDLLEDFQGSIKKEIHLMVKEPLGWLEKCSRIFCDRVVAQVEMMENIDIFHQKAVDFGMEVGLALDISTPLEKVPEDLYPKLDTVLLMAIKSGWGGQDFNPEVLPKIEKVKKIVGDLVEIGVDGGLNEENIVKCKQAGATLFYVGKTFWEAGDLRRRYEELTGLLK